MSSHSLGKNDLIITAQPSRQHLSAKATVLATEMMLGKGFYFILIISTVKKFSVKYILKGWVN